MAREEFLVFKGEVFYFERFKIMVCRGEGACFYILLDEGSSLDITHAGVVSNDFLETLIIYGDELWSNGINYIIKLSKEKWEDYISKMCKKE
jgi:hypothetical protein